MDGTPPNIGRIITTSRRGAVVLSSAGARIDGRMSGELAGICVGDLVRFEDGGGGITYITEILPRKNCLQRAYQGRQKKLAANLDRLFVVTATGPLFNHIFIDRILAVAGSEDIPVTIVLNKVDQDLESTNQKLMPYREMGISVLLTAAKFDQGLEELRETLGDQCLKIVVLAGLSGVGKSTLLNQLVPGAVEKTSEVSRRTGQGKQTTSQSRGFLLPRLPGEPLMVIDLPGVQMFGVTHLTLDQVRRAFPEFLQHGRCGFDNCSHLREDDCAVQQAVKAGLISFSRYESYLGMSAELEAERTAYRKVDDSGSGRK